MAVKKDAAMLTRTCRLLVIFLVSSTASVSIAAQQSFDKRFAAPPGGHLTLDTDVGSVRIVGRDTREVVVHADNSDSDQLQITAEQNASGVIVTGRVTRNWFGWFAFSGTHVRFTIDVPRDYPVQIKTSGGDLDVRNLTASVEGKTSGGSITIRDVIGSINTRTSGGSIDAERINGPAELGTSGGNIDIDDSTGDLSVYTSGGRIDLKSLDGKVRAITSGGSVHAEVHNNRGVFLGTSGGTITLLLPENVHASIEARTSGGRAQSELALSSTDIAEHSYLRGTLNGGGEPITLRTSGGSIHVAALQ
jgi:DUF4097 and DUF4098 domain-containing protein YvlB